MAHLLIFFSHKHIHPQRGKVKSERRPQFPFVLQVPPQRRCPRYVPTIINALPPMCWDFDACNAFFYNVGLCAGNCLSPLRFRPLCHNSCIGHVRNATHVFSIADFSRWKSNPIFFFFISSILITSRCLVHNMGFLFSFDTPVNTLKCFFFLNLMSFLRRVFKHREANFGSCLISPIRFGLSCLVCSMRKLSDRLVAFSQVFLKIGDALSI